MQLRDEDLPALFHAADRAGSEGQRWHVEAVRASLFLSLLAAALGVPNLEDVGDWPSIAAAVAFGSGALVTLYLYWGRPERRWYDGRAAAESLKTLAWQWAVGGGTFPKGPDEAAEHSNEDAFARRLREVLAGLRNVEIGAERGEQITATMRAVRAADLATRRGVYQNDRIEDQRRWYDGKARWNRRRGRQWLAVTVSIQVAGGTLGILRAADVLNVDLLGLVAAAAAAAAAWLQVKDHGTLAEAYTVAAQELALIGDQISRVTDENAWRAFVDHAEQAISREHVLWRARRGRVSPAELPPAVA